MERMTRWNPETEEAECEIDGVVHTGSITTRLAEYEDTGLDPEEVRGIKTAYDEVQLPYEVVATGADAARVIRLLDAEDEGRLIVLPCGDDVTPVKCTGMKCPMQAGKAGPETCKAADTCKWTTKPMTNADKIRAMSDEELAALFTRIMAGNNGPRLNGIWQERGMEENQRYFIKLNWLDWLKQEVEDGH